MGLTTRTTAVLGAALVLGWLGATSASAAAPDVPPAVAAWFAQDAAGVAHDVLVDGAKDIAASGVAPAGTFTVGEPVRLHHFDPAFVEGETDEALTASDEWVATLYRDGVATGTIAAIDAAGAVRFSYVDNDAPAGIALAEAPTGDIVQDAQLGGLLEVGADGAVDGLSRVTQEQVAGVDTTAELQAVVAEAHEPESQTLAVDSGFGGTSDPVDLRTVAGLALLGAGIAGLAWRRVATRAR